MFPFAKIFTFFLLFLHSGGNTSLEEEPDEKKKKKKMRNQGRTHPIPKVSFLVPFNFIEGSFITLEYAIHSSFWRTPGHSQIL